MPVVKMTIKIVRYGHPKNWGEPFVVVVAREEVARNAKVCITQLPYQLEHKYH